MDIGARIKRVRNDLGLTLKDVEERAGVSAAHVSEIERGEASPTLGSLARIASALRKSPAFFLEENELGEVSLVGAKDRVRERVGTSGVRRSNASIEHLTAGVPGGSLQVRRVELPAGSTYRGEHHQHAGFEAIIVVSGHVKVEAGEATFDLGPGDAAHFDATLLHGYSNGSRDDVAVLIWVATRRDID